VRLILFLVAVMAVEAGIPVEAEGAEASSLMGYLHAKIDSEELLQPEDVDDLSCTQAWLLANTVLAANGYIFNDEQAIEQFAFDSIYVPNPEVTYYTYADHLNPADTWNLDLLMGVELARCEDGLRTLTVPPVLVMGPGGAMTEALASTSVDSGPLVYEPVQEVFTSSMSDEEGDDFGFYAEVTAGEGAPVIIEFAVEEDGVALDVILIEDDDDHDEVIEEEPTPFESEVVVQEEEARPEPTPEPAALVEEETQPEPEPAPELEPEVTCESQEARIAELETERDRLAQKVEELGQLNANLVDANAALTLDAQLAAESVPILVPDQPVVTEEVVVEPEPVAVVTDYDTLLTSVALGNVADKELLATLDCDQTGGLYWAIPARYGVPVEEAIGLYTNTDRLNELRLARQAREQGCRLVPPAGS